MGAITDVNQIGIRSVYLHVDSFNLVSGGSVNLFDAIVDRPVDFMGTLLVNVSNPGSGNAYVARIRIWAGCGSILMSLDQDGAPMVEALVSGNSFTPGKITVVYSPPSANMSAYLSVYNGYSVEVFVSAFLMLDSFTLYAQA